MLGGVEEKKLHFNIEQIYISDGTCEWDPCARGLIKLLGAGEASLAFKRLFRHDRCRALTLPTGWTHPQVQNTMQLWSGSEGLGAENQLFQFSMDFSIFRAPRNRISVNTEGVLHIWFNSDTQSYICCSHIKLYLVSPNLEKGLVLFIRIFKGF